MSKQDVIDYVMETPHNTNRAVLEGLVDTAVEESQVQADWDQNDETAKDYIKNRPGGYYIHAPVLGISKDITLNAISATSARFYITFIGEDDDESFDKYDETLILHFFGKEIPISYNTSHEYYVVNETINGITIGIINDNYYDKKTTWSATYNIEKESILTPDDHTPSKISKLENDSNYITAAHVYDGILISSSTPNSTKKFKITVDDTGALTATEVTGA